MMLAIVLMIIIDNYMMLTMVLMRNHWELHDVGYSTDEKSLAIT